MVGAAEAGLSSLWQMAQLEFDENLAESLEVLYRRRDVLRRRRLVHDALDAQPGERVLDVGCGPGFYVAELLERVATFYRNERESVSAHRDR